MRQHAHLLLPLQGGQPVGRSPYRPRNTRRVAKRSLPTDTPPPPATPKAARLPWPKTLPEQIKAVRNAVAAEPAPATAEQLARQFNRAQTRKVTELLETLQAIGQVQADAEGRYLTH